MPVAREDRDAISDLCAELAQAVEQPVRPPVGLRPRELAELVRDGDLVRLAFDDRLNEKRQTITFLGSVDGSRL